jgi:hypothetical protein
MGVVAAAVVVKERKETKDGRAEGRTEGRTEGRKEGKKERRKVDLVVAAWIELRNTMEERKGGRKEGKKERRKEGRVWSEEHMSFLVCICMLT